MPTFSDPNYVAEIVQYPSDSTAYVLIWNSAATVSNPTCRAYKNKVDISADVLTGSNSSSSNVQTGKVITYRDADAGEDIVYEWRADVEGKTLNRRLLITVAALPR